MPSSPEVAHFGPKERENAARYLEELAREAERGERLRKLADSSRLRGLAQALRSLDQSACDTKTHEDWCSNDRPCAYNTAPTSSRPTRDDSLTRALAHQRPTTELLGNIRSIRQTCASLSSALNLDNATGDAADELRQAHEHLVAAEHALVQKLKP